MKPIFLWLIIYVVLLLGYHIINWLEHRKHFEKKRRYQHLPLRFKLVCGLVVLPIFTTAIFASFIGHTLLHFCWIVALGTTLWLEQKVIFWYQQHGFL